MAMAAIAASVLFPPLVWTIAVMREIMDVGDNIYNNISHEEDYIHFSELPDIIKFDKQDTVISVNTDIVKSGILAKTEDENLDTLESALLFCEKKGVSGCLLTACGFTIAIIWDVNKLYIFDSHQRTDEGFISENGNAVLLQFANMGSVIEHIRELYAAWPNEQFDCIPVYGKNLSIDVAVSVSSDDRGKGELRKKYMCEYQRCDRRQPEVKEKIRWQEKEYQHKAEVMKACAKRKKKYECDVEFCQKRKAQRMEYLSKPAVKNAVRSKVKEY